MTTALYAPRGAWAARDVALLMMDIYEYSYQMDFRAATTKYVAAFFESIR